MYGFGYLLAFNVLIAIVFYALCFTQSHKAMLRNCDSKGFDTFQVQDRIFVVSEARLVLDKEKDSNATQ
jgi:hypothetical protein